MRDRLRLLLTLAFCVPVAFSASAGAAAHKPSTKQKVQPERKEWCSQLRQAADRARGLEPGMKSYSLLLASRGLKACAPGKVRSTLIDAFLASIAIPDDDPAKTSLQSSALRGLLRIDEPAVEQLLPQAAPQARAEIEAAMIDRALEKQDLDRALALLNQIPADQDFPYSAATQLILRLPAGHEAEKRAIFMNAMAHDHEQASLGDGDDDLAAMVVRFWRHFPPELVLDAIDQILDESKSDNTQIGMNASSGRINFNNVYQYRLFELLPILRELDSSKAEQLSNDPEVQAQLNRYPNGMQSLDPTVRDTPLKKGEEPQIMGVSMTSPGASGKLLEEQRAAELYRHQAEDILKQAADNPRQAIAAASTLPVQAGPSAPRAETSVKVARAAWRKNPSAAKEALEQMSESLKKIDPAMYGRLGFKVRQCWSDGIDIANSMKDTDLAKSLVQAGLDQAERWKTIDSDDSDPNRALKAWWPSVALFSSLVTSAAHVSPQMALELIHGLQDPDLSTLFLIRLANDRVGASNGETQIRIKKKNQNWQMMMGPGGANEDVRN
jgi:hypothetical protein